MKRIFKEKGRCPYLFGIFLSMLVCLGLLPGCVAQPARVENPFEAPAAQSAVSYRSLSLGIVLTPNTRNTIAYTDSFGRSVFST